MILGLRFWARQAPGALVLVVLGILATRLLGLEIALVGDVPSGLPSLVLPGVAYLTENISVILPAAVGILLIGFSQSAGDAREFASKHGIGSTSIRSPSLRAWPTSAPDCPGNPGFHQPLGQLVQ